MLDNLSLIAMAMLAAWITFLFFNAATMAHDICRGVAEHQCVETLP